MRDLASFAVYFIPSEGSFYDAGSQALGYDIRQGRPVTPFDFINQDWTLLARDYGFHLSITDAIYIPPHKLAAVREEMIRVLTCLSTSGGYRCVNKGLAYWHDTLLAAEQVPGKHLQQLHDILVTALHPMGTGSVYTEAYNQGTLRLIPNSPDAAKLHTFHSPYIFENYKPHFTYVHSPNSLDDHQRSELLRALQAHANIPEVLHIDQLSLVYRPPGEQQFYIDTVFEL